MGESSNVSDAKGQVETQKETKEEDLGQRHPGEVSLVELSRDEINDLIDYMTVSNHGTYLDLLYSIIGPDKILLYLETLENLTVRIPPKKTIVKILFYIRVYNYLKKRDFSEEAYKSASKIYRKRVFDLKRVVNKVQTVLEKYQYEELQ